jgi:hypothetical protein
VTTGEIVITALLLALIVMHLRKTHRDYAQLRMLHLMVDAIKVRVLGK